MRPQCGGAQGDVGMSTNFRSTYDPVIEQWMTAKKEVLSTITGSDPLTFKYIDVSVTVYADDVKEINMASAADEAIATIRASTNILNEGLIPVPLKQNEDKAEHILSFLGNGQEKLTKLFTTGVVGYP